MSMRMMEGCRDRKDTERISLLQGMVILGMKRVCGFGLEKFVGGRTLIRNGRVSIAECGKALDQLLNGRGRFHQVAGRDILRIEDTELFFEG